MQTIQSGLTDLFIYTKFSSKKFKIESFFWEKEDVQKLSHPPLPEWRNIIINPILKVETFPMTKIRVYMGSGRENCVIGLILGSKRSNVPNFVKICEKLRSVD